MTACYPRHRPPRCALHWLILTLAGSCGARATTLAQHVEITIPAGRAVDSVRALAQQTNLNILLSGQLADDVMTNALQGSFTAADAVTHIIAGTPLTFAMPDEHTVSIWSCAEFRCASSDSIGSDNQNRRDRDADAPSHAIAAPQEISQEQVDVNGVRTPIADYTPEPSLRKILISKQQIDQSGALTLSGTLGTLTQVFPAGVLRSAIGVVHQPRRRLPHGNRLLQCP